MGAGEWFGGLNAEPHGGARRALLAWMPGLETMHNTCRVPGPAATDAESHTLRRHPPSPASRSCTARLHIDVAHHLVANLHIDIALYYHSAVALPSFLWLESSPRRAFGTGTPSFSFRMSRSWRFSDADAGSCCRSQQRDVGFTGHLTMYAIL